MAGHYLKKFLKAVKKLTKIEKKKFNICRPYGMRSFKSDSVL